MGEETRLGLEIKKASQNRGVQAGGVAGLTALLVTAGPMLFDYLKDVGAADDQRLDSAHERTFATLQAATDRCEERALTAAERSEKQRFGLELRIVKFETKADECSQQLLDLLHEHAVASAGGTGDTLAADGGLPIPDSAIAITGGIE